MFDRTSSPNEVYEELRRVAKAELSKHRRSETLNTGALIHETFIRIFADKDPSFEGKKHFYALAAKVMRQVVIDFARKRMAACRNSGRESVSLDSPLSLDRILIEDQAAQIVAIHQAMERLERIDPRSAAVLELRFFAGLEVSTVAELLGISEKSVQRDTLFGQAFLGTEVNV